MSARPKATPNCLGGRVSLGLPLYLSLCRHRRRTQMHLRAGKLKRRASKDTRKRKEHLKSETTCAATATLPAPLGASCKLGTHNSNQNRNHQSACARRARRPVNRRVEHDRALFCSGPLQAVCDRHRRAPPDNAIGLDQDSTNDLTCLSALRLLGRPSLSVKQTSGRARRRQTDGQTRKQTEGHALLSDCNLSRRTRNWRHAPGRRARGLSDPLRAPTGISGARYELRHSLNVSLCRYLRPLE